LPVAFLVHARNPRMLFALRLDCFSRSAVFTIDGQTCLNPGYSTECHGNFDAEEEKLVFPSISTPSPRTAYLRRFRFSNDGAAKRARASFRVQAWFSSFARRTPATQIRLDVLQQHASTGGSCFSLRPQDN